MFIYIHFKMQKMKFICYKMLYITVEQKQEKARTRNKPMKGKQALNKYSHKQAR